jgi:hydrogenase expression/formation protein HypE
MTEDRNPIQTLIQTPIQDQFVTLAYGNGGRYMRELIAQIFARHLANPQLDTGADAAHLPMPPGEVMVTTDGFTVQPLEFPGGDIGSLAVHGTVNDLAVSGATPVYLTLNAFIEEGLEFALLDRLIASMARAAQECGVRVAAGDTKVLRRGEGGGLYLATTGIGVRRAGLNLGLGRIQDGDVVLVSGAVGDHGTAVLLAREDFGLKGDLKSDATSVLPLAHALLNLPGLRFMRDPTRGGLVTVMHEIAHATGLTVRLTEDTIPIHPPVRGICDILGYDPLYLACEGRVVAVLSPDDARHALAHWRALPGGEEAAIIGRLSGPGAQVVLQTEIGGERLLEELEDDPLPRIC